MINVSKIRDLTLVKLDNKKTMVIACDSCGSVGMKEHDVLKVPPYYTGRYTMRVALMEVLCAGADVIAITNAVCNEMKPTGEDVINGIKDELKDAGVIDVVLTGSTEENFNTYSTGVGITTIGIAQTRSLKVNSIKEKCLLISVGLPKVGGEINLTNDIDIIDYDSIKYLLKLKDVYEIVPVGSKGILYESEELAKENNMKFRLMTEVKVDLYKTAGPATVIIVAINEKSYDKIKILRNMNIIGEIF